MDEKLVNDTKDETTAKLVSKKKKAKKRHHGEFVSSFMIPETSCITS